MCGHRVALGAYLGNKLHLLLQKDLELAGIAQKQKWPLRQALLPLRLPSPVTDPSPTMVALATAKLSPLGSRAEIATGEELEDFAARHLSAGGKHFDGAFSNFAPLNCVVDVGPVAHGLAQLLKPGAPAMLVLFGTFCPGEMFTEVLHKRPDQALRRCKRGPLPARLAKRNFPIVYHRRAAVMRAFAPRFVLEKRLGIGVTVPPSAAEPWISHHPRRLGAMEAFDRALSRPLAFLGDDVLYQFRRTAER